MNKFLVLLLVACLLALPLSGCSFQFDLNDNADSGDDSQDPGDNGDVPNDGDADESWGEYTQKILAGDAFYPADYTQVLAKYKEFGYEWTVSSETQTDTVYFHYLYEGSEEVDGVPAEVYIVTLEQAGEPYVEKHWYNSQWDCIKVMVDGQVQSWPYFSMPTQVTHYVNLVLNAQMIFDEDGCIDTLVYSLEEEGTGTQGSPIGSMEVYVLSSLLYNDVYSYGVTEHDGGLVFALIRQGYSDTQDYEELKITELVDK